MALKSCSAKDKFEETETSISKVEHIICSGKGFQVTVTHTHAVRAMVQVQVCLNTNNVQTRANE